jgi:hypothetical protein
MEVDAARLGAGIELDESASRVRRNVLIRKDFYDRR